MMSNIPSLFKIQSCRSLLYFNCKQINLFLGGGGMKLEWQLSTKLCLPHCFLYSSRLKHHDDYIGREYRYGFKIFLPVIASPVSTEPESVQFQLGIELRITMPPISRTYALNLETSVPWLHCLHVENQILLTEQY